MRKSSATIRLRHATKSVFCQRRNDPHARRTIKIVKTRPILYFWRWIREPSKNLNRVDVMVIDKERHRTINPKVTDQHANDAEGRSDQRAKQQCAVFQFGPRSHAGTSNWLISLKVP